jgi:hypothetical protein
LDSEYLQKKYAINPRISCFPGSSYYQVSNGTELHYKNINTEMKESLKNIYGMNLIYGPIDAVISFNREQGYKYTKRYREKKKNNSNNNTTPPDPSALPPPSPQE